MAPEEGMRRLVEFNANIWIEMPELIRLLASENLLGARHVKQSKVVPQLYNPIMQTIEELPKRGAKEGVFREGVDPIAIYTSISALSAYLITNRQTFQELTKTNVTNPKRTKT